MPPLDPPDLLAPAAALPRRAVWAEDASVVFGVAGAVLTIGTLLAVGWLALWQVPVLHEPGLALVAGVDLVLVLLAVACHQLALELAVVVEPLDRSAGAAHAHPG
ncbi:hypothetical protein KSP35_15080 [Aquihabitans sp. G128]|uniref:hypothetical protein n=1 Tax=Aquihabitans sp. G128 TaxID=2849779 RepID=UPI001C25073A|nr:hypothetical protein [Aquihabitans sp. G128]QXC59699.1 hypothetical protein KSP35_15080 [Aquihabitans sp. G128]